MKIGELGKITGIKVETIRFYEQAGLLPKPSRTPNNYRSYGGDHVKRLSFIRRARELGIALDHVRELMTLSDDPNQSCAAVDEIARAHLAEVERKLADLDMMRVELTRILAACKSGRVGTCKIIETLSQAVA
jgi:Cu(I)-responsive transcriptional regulator